MVRKQRELLDLTADAESRRGFLHPDYAHATMQEQASLGGPKPRWRNVNRTLNALAQRERHVRNPVDTVTTEIRGGSLQNGSFWNLEELNRTLEIYPLPLAPFPNQPVHGFMVERSTFAAISAAPASLGMRF